MEKKNINLSYPIITEAVFEEISQFISAMHPAVSKIYILVDENTHMHCVAPLVRNINLLENAEILEIDAGEEQKNIEIVNRLWQVLADNNVDRQALIINLGGGVISDMGGFMASIYKRGIRFINIPTSLLAMVDASIGGKTGVDFGTVKNQLGCFSNPEAVFIWPEFLKTLPKEELLSGFGEIVKYALINDLQFWNIIRNLEFTEIEDFDEFIFESIEIKSNIVAADPKEQGLRKVLNFGHTYGHAFESLSMMHSGNTKLSHGKAIALGIICDLWHSVQKSTFPESVFIEIKDYIFKNFGSFSIQDNQIGQLLDLMKKDKKNSDNKIATILLESIGNPIADKHICEEEVYNCLKYFQNL